MWRRWIAALIVTAALVFLSASAALSGRASDDDAILCTIGQHQWNWALEHSIIEWVDEPGQPINCKP